MRGVVGRTGFEPVKAVPSDLQSDPFGRSGISPCGSGSGDRSWRSARHSRRLAVGGRRRSRTSQDTHLARATVLPCPPRDRFVFPVSVRRAATAGLGRGAAGASGGTRTRNLLITNQLLCQLSHAGVQQGLPRGEPWRPTSDLRDPGPGGGADRIGASPPSSRARRGSFCRGPQRSGDRQPTSRSSRASPIEGP